mmetsp:Transcript_94329/g.266359  ORF Transcript_94329/g.266359 Transcript_94329/m.266359 type:complete len:666 (-) Transcript_94329:72-2069(-)
MQRRLSVCSSWRRDLRSRRCDGPVLGPSSVLRQSSWFAALSSLLMQSDVALAEPGCRMTLRWKSHLSTHDQSGPVSGDIPHTSKEELVESSTHREHFASRDGSRQPNVGQTSASNASPSVGPSSPTSSPPQIDPAFPRAMTAPDGEHIAVVWQDGGALVLQRFAHDCARTGRSVLVTGALGLTPLQQPPEAGLVDVLSLTGNGIAVAWVVDGSMWVKVVEGESARPQVRASGAGRVMGGEATMAASPHSDGGFVVAWSGVGRDGEGQVIFARFFDAFGQPRGPERQVSSCQRCLRQRRPHLISCGSGAAGPSVWILWTEQVASTMPEDGRPCDVNDTSGNATIAAGVCLRQTALVGPFVRRLGANDFALGPEVNLSAGTKMGGTQMASVSAATFMCGTKSSTENPRVVWASRQLGQPMHSASILWSNVIEDDGGIPKHDVTAMPLVQLALVNSKPSLFLPPKTEGNQQERGRSSRAPGSSGPKLPAAMLERMALVAEGEVLAVVANDASGSLSAQLFKMAPVATYPTHDIVWASATVEHAIYDVTEDQALLICWSGFLAIVCERRTLKGLMHEESSETALLVGAMAIFLFFLILYGGGPKRVGGNPFSLQPQASQKRWPMDVSTNKAITNMFRMRLQQLLQARSVSPSDAAALASRWRQHMPKRF